MPTSADHPLVLTLEDGIGGSKFGTISDNVLKLSMTRTQIPDKWLVDDKCLASAEASNLPPRSKKTILARLWALEAIKATFNSEAAFRTQLTNGINKDTNIEKIKKKKEALDADFRGKKAEDFIALIKGTLAVSAQAYLATVAGWGKLPGGPGAPIDFTGDSLQLVKQANYNGTIHWTGHGNEKDLLSYPAYNHMYYTLPVDKLANLLLQQDATVKPTLLVFNSCNTGKEFIFTMRNALAATGRLPDAGITLNAPLSTASGAEVTQNLKRWQDGEIDLPWPSITSTNDIPVAT